MTRHPILARTSGRSQAKAGRALLDPIDPVTIAIPIHSTSILNICEVRDEFGMRMITHLDWGKCKI